MKKRKVLYVGFDESGNGMPQSVCLNVFSNLLEDIFIDNFSTKRDKTLLENLKSKERDFRFTLFNKDNFTKKFGKRNGYNHITYTCPKLIKNFIYRNQEFDKLELFIDGEVNKRDKNIYGDKSLDEINYYRKYIEIIFIIVHYI